MAACCQPTLHRCSLPLARRHIGSWSHRGRRISFSNATLAAPHVTGVAALIVSQGTTLPGAVAAKINNTADPIACPADVSEYAPFPADDNNAPQVCQGGAAYNSWYGHGQVNALSAVTQ